MIPVTHLAAFGLGCTLLIGGFGNKLMATEWPSPQREITVFADPVARTAMRDAIVAFQAKHPDVIVRPRFAGSRVIGDWLRHGARPDAVIVASTEAQTISDAIAEPVQAFGDHTTIVVSAAARARVHAPADLAANGVRVGVGRAGTLLADLDRATIAKLAPAQAEGYAARVAANAAEEEHDTTREALANALADGSIDAAILYASDVVPGKSVELPLESGARTSVVYDAAVLRGASDAAGAQAFVAYLTSASGTAIFRAHGHDAALP